MKKGAMGRSLLAGRLLHSNWGRGGCGGALGTCSGEKFDRDPCGHPCGILEVLTGPVVTNRAQLCAGFDLTSGQLGASLRH